MFWKERAVCDTKCSLCGCIIPEGDYLFCELRRVDKRNVTYRYCSACGVTQLIREAYHLLGLLRDALS